jgi:hypothetical protein
MEVAGMMAIGDGLVAAIAPAEHIALWRGRPAAWDRILQPFARHPVLTRVVGVSEVGVGLWMVLRQLRSAPRR